MYHEEGGLGDVLIRGPEGKTRNLKRQSAVDTPPALTDIEGGAMV